ncbi:MAG TPA: hypothetical protein VIP46_01035 [Pyrinomonadaceae bacterium]
MIVTVAGDGPDTFSSRAPASRNDTRNVAAVKLSRGGTCRRATAERP